MMNIAPFETEHFYARYEFNTPYQLCNSDCETVSVGELLDMADVSLEQLAGLSLGYTESQGNPHLRGQLAEAYPQVRAEDIMILGTPVEGIYLAARALLEPNDEVIVLTPAYDALINMFEHVVGTDRVKRWAFVPTADSWTLNLDDLRRLITPQTKLVVVNFPHNPTGYLPTPGQLEDLVEIVEQHNLRLFYDEMYFGLVHSGTQPVASAATLTKRAIVLSGLSKTYGLPGLRTGWLIVQDAELRDNLMNWKFYTSICPPAPSEFLATAAWRVRDQLRDRSIAQIEQNLKAADDFFARWPDLFTWRRPQAGSTALVEIHVPSVTELAETLAKDAGVLIHPGTTLGSDDRHMRMGFGRRGFSAALEKFEQYLKRQIDI
ncbi:MAG: pyridoxal phosphate-dependent aminotransferase [Ardenticatenaceae bacterium]|nr:pyridoxal phosphate-dependent aminotransferase [Ardenticatenaceae bacterium]